MSWIRGSHGDTEMWPAACRRHGPAAEHPAAAQHLHPRNAEGRGQMSWMPDGLSDGLLLQKPSLAAEQGCAS